MITARAVLVAAMLVGAAALAQAADDPLASLPRHVALNAHQHSSGQPSAEALAGLHDAGIQTVIDLRPDAETPDLDEKSVAEKAGLKYRSLPISGAADLTRENVSKFDQLLKASADENVLVHCASGNRVGAMMALRAHWIDGKSAEESLAIGKAAGMTGLAGEVQKLVDGATAAAK